MTFGGPASWAYQQQREEEATKRVQRHADGDELPTVTVREDCPWCGDERADSECLRRCPASRVNRTDDR